MHTRQILFVVSVLYMASGCAETPLAPSGTVAKQETSQIVDYVEHQKKLMARNGEDYLHAALGTLQKLNLTAQVGSPFKDDKEAIWIEGKPFQGLQVIVKGPAFQQGLLGPPRECHSEVCEEVGGKLIQQATVVFQPAGPGSFRAQFPMLRADRAIKFNMVAPALNKGTSQYTVMVTALNGEATPYSIVRTISILPKTVYPADYSAGKSDATAGATSNFVQQGGVSAPQGNSSPQ